MNNSMSHINVISGGLTKKIFSSQRPLKYYKTNSHIILHTYKALANWVTFLSAASLYRRRDDPAEFAAFPVASLADCFFPAFARTTYL